MSDLKATPGPWVKDLGMTVGHIKAQDHSNGWTPTVCKYLPGDGAAITMTKEEADANAHLIAAAPDLYKALESAEKKLKDVVEFLIANPPTYELNAVWDGAECDGACLHDECRGMAEDIANLRAKARGEGR